MAVVPVTVMVDPDGVHVSGDDHPVVEIVLAVPPVNAISESFIEQVLVAVERASAPTARVIVVRSALPDTFVAGADLFALVDPDVERGRAYVERIQALVRSLMAVPQVVVAGVHGHCLGGGLELALAADIVVAADDARLGLPEVTLGIMAAAGGLHQLERRVGAGTARYLLLTGRPVDATRALAIGLVDDVVPRDDLVTAVQALAGRIAGFPHQAVLETTALARSASGRTLEEGLDAELGAWVRMRGTAQTQEALEAFAARRAPR